MGSIQVRNVTKQYGGAVILDDVSVELHSGKTVGVIGPNGAGKSTLFKLICGLIEPDFGEISASRNLKIGYLSQEPQLDSQATVHDEVLSVFENLFDIERRMHEVSERLADKHDTQEASELMKQYDRLTVQFEAAGGYGHEQKIGEVLDGLGFSQADRDLKVAVLSGGQKCRVALAKLLLEEHAMLLMDEPTNHLDIDAVRWLEKFLAGHRGGAAIISHDRYLLDRVADSIIEVERRKIAEFPGNYSNYVKTKATRTLTLERQFEKDQAFIAKERDFIARHMAGQRTKEAQGRRTRLERRIGDGEFVLEKPIRRKNIRFDFDATEDLSGQVLRVSDLAKAYDERALFRDLRFQVDASQRVGITGPNGTGKTTLLRIIQNQLAADAGDFAWHSHASIGYYAQQAGQMEDAGTVLDEIRAAKPTLSEEQARTLLGGFQFTGDDVFRSVAVLSGGEQSRIRLIKLLLSSSNVLVLDEPTNHLDIASREALEAALLDYPGTIIAVSHDRYFLDRIVTRLLVMRADGYRMVYGNYSEYVALTERESSGMGGESDGKTARRRAKTAPAPKSKNRSPTARFDAHSVEELEQMIIETEERISETSQQFAAPEVYNNPVKLAEVREQLESLKAELAVIEAAWNERTESA